MSSFVDGYTVDDAQYEACASADFVANPADGRRGKPFVEIGLPDHRFSGPLRRLLLGPETLTAKVDTGADMTAFNRDGAKSVATLMNLDLSSYDPAAIRMVQVADGTICVGVVHHIDLYVCDQLIEDVPVLLPVPYNVAMNCYLDRVNGLSLHDWPRLTERSIRRNLLGTEGITENVLLCVDSERLYIFKRKKSRKQH